jgi:hypothetical protein
MFYFAWVDPTETTFGPEHQVVNEQIFSADIEHAEGDFPAFTIEILNPRIGLLNPGRKVWAWFSRDSGGTAGAEPLFFGRLVGIPSNVFAEIITLEFTAKPIDWISQRQLLAEAMKTEGPYDPVFIDVTKRDDPDTILEARSERWHIDRTSLQVTSSDYLNGEEGEVVFDVDAAFYDSLDMRRASQSPITAIMVDASVSWTQTARGTVDIGNKTFFSYSGDGLISEWPKPLQTLSSGWSVQYSNAVDAWRIATSLTASFSRGYRNEEKTHITGDVMSISESTVKPQLNNGKVLSYDLTFYNVTGLIDPYGVDIEGDPDPVNRPATQAITTMYVPQWQVNTSLVLRYDAARQRTERVVFLLQSDLQAIVTSPLVTQDSELITRTGCDVGVPIFATKNWTSVRGQHVNVGQVIFPDNPTLPGGTTTQIYTTAGTTGLVEPVFSDIEGDTTVDGTAVATSLGTTGAPSSAGDWTAVTPTPKGKIILPQRPFFTSWATLEQAGLVQFPQVGVSVTTNQIIQASNGSFQVCFLSGTTGITEPAFSTTWGVETVDGSVTWIGLGMSLPTGTNFFLCTGEGTTGPILQIPNFNNDLNATTTDGGVTWTSIGSGDIPIGGYPGQVTRPSYFDTDMGKRSLEYLFNIGIAPLRMRARAVQVSWQCRFEKAIGLSCRKTATLIDSRLPGGQATGKIIAYSLKAHGDRGELIGSVTIGCAVGHDGSVEVVPGTACYVDGYFNDGEVQQWTGSTVLLPGGRSDFGYTPIVSGVVDDGLTFPLDKNQVVVSEATHGSLADQEGGIQSAFVSARYAANLGITHPVTGVSTSIINQQLAATAGQNSVAFELQRNPIWYDLQLKPVVNGPFNAEYSVKVTNLKVPKQIDLEAASV